MLGSVTEADDAVQDAWIRLSRTDTSEVENLRVLVTHNNPDAPGHVRSRAPGSAIVTARTAGFSVQ